MGDVLRFRLNGQAVEIGDVAPTETLLNWLRNRQGLTGTKEGCAEGDCGACTVALREPGPEGLITRPVCACIQLMGMVQGCDIVTVEGLAAPDGRLHPVQRAMVEQHGSQCGFCTPGIVMSLWCGWRGGKLPTLRVQNDLLAGNLCRCTGYGPILAAGRAAYRQTADWEERDEAVAEALGALAGRALDYAGQGRRFIAPVTIDDLAEAVLAHPDAVLVAGATDVGLWITKQGFDPQTVIHTARVAELCRMDERDGMLWIGAGVRYADVLELLVRHCVALFGLVQRIGARQVRAMGTIGGNIANGSPIGDMAPALIALGARLVLRRGRDRREIELEDFFLDYGRQDLRLGEFVEAVRVPIPEDRDRLACYKAAKRHDQDISAVLGCFDVHVEDGRVVAARLAFGGMAGTPMRARAAEAALSGREWGEAAVAAAAEALGRDFAPIDDHRGSAAYRMQTARALLWRLYRLRTDPAAAATVWEVG